MYIRVYVYTCIHVLLYIVYCILHIAYCILYIEYCILYIVYVYCICTCIKCICVYIYIYRHSWGNIWENDCTTFSGASAYCWWFSLTQIILVMALVFLGQAALESREQQTTHWWPTKKTQTYTVFLTYPPNETHPMANPSCLCLSLSLYIYIEILCIPHIPPNMNKQKYIPKFRVAPPVSPHKTAGRTVPSSGAF